MKNYIQEVIVASILATIAALLWNPYWMPMGVVYAVLVCFMLVLGGFVVFIWRERGGDEREVFIRHAAGRVAYIMSSCALALGIVWQTVTVHTVDPWLVASFILALLAKILGFVVFHKRM